MKTCLSFLTLALAATLAHADVPVKAVNGMLVNSRRHDRSTPSTRTPPAAARAPATARAPKLWPPVMADADAKPEGDWTIVTRDDGSKQWAYKGKPVYLYESDMKAGDTTGDNFKNVWHVVKPDPTPDPTRIAARDRTKPRSWPAYRACAAMRAGWSPTATGRRPGAGHARARLVPRRLWRGAGTCAPGCSASCTTCFVDRLRAAPRPEDSAGDDAARGAGRADAGRPRSSCATCRARWIAWRRSSARCCCSSRSRTWAMRTCARTLGIPIGTVMSRLSRAASGCAPARQAARRAGRPPSA